MSAGSSNLSSWVRTTIAVWWSGRDLRERLLRPLDDELVRGRDPLARRELRARVRHDRVPAEELRAPAHRLGRVDGAVDEEARRRPVPLGEHLRAVRRARGAGCARAGSARRTARPPRRARRRPARRTRRRAPSCPTPSPSIAGEEHPALLGRAELGESVDEPHFRLARRRRRSRRRTAGRRSRRGRPSMP